MLNSRFKIKVHDPQLQISIIQNDAEVPCVRFVFSPAAERSGVHERMRVAALRPGAAAGCTTAYAVANEK